MLRDARRARTLATLTEVTVAPTRTKLRPQMPGEHVLTRESDPGRNTTRTTLTLGIPTYFQQLQRRPDSQIDVKLSPFGQDGRLRSLWWAIGFLTLLCDRPP